MSGNRIPGPCVVIGHQVPEVNVLIHRFEIHALIIRRACRSLSGEQQDNEDGVTKAYLPVKRL